MRRIASRHWKASVAFVHDVVMAGSALLFATWLRLGTVDHPAFDTVVLIGLPVFVAIAGFCFLVSGMYRGIWSYALVSGNRAKNGGLWAVVHSVLKFFQHTLIDQLASMPVDTF